MKLSRVYEGNCAVTKRWMLLRTAVVAVFVVAGAIAISHYASHSVAADPLIARNFVWHHLNQLSDSRASNQRVSIRVAVVPDTRERAVPNGSSG